MHQTLAHSISLKKVLLDIKGQIDSDTIIADDFNISFSSPDR
jgi:hypothetical protein